MSYSFAVRAATKDEAVKKVEEQLAQVVTSQPVHEADRQAAQDAANAFIGQLSEPTEGNEIAVYVSGSLGWQGDMAEKNFTSANVSVNASVLAKTA